ncbi:hypothetical protein [Bacillus alkalicellulosilyticus]|uniref:hypothetical protein n=1 Tax=Alkalihalobacterium alkalicellulosilyticum TaxID=1912214 RepID=UPI000997708D|nr:hypothetical protein [Bacillus alkalicellulosilyticus]
MKWFYIIPKRYIYNKKNTDIHQSVLQSINYLIWLLIVPFLLSIFNALLYVIEYGSHSIGRAAEKLIIYIGILGLPLKWNYGAPPSITAFLINFFFFFVLLSFSFFF